MTEPLKSGQVLYCVLNPQAFADMKGIAMGMEAVVAEPDEEPFWYLPVFTTYEAALAWNGGPNGILPIRGWLAVQPPAIMVTSKKEKTTS